MAANSNEDTLRWQPSKGIDSKRPNHPALRLSPRSSNHATSSGTIRSFPPPRYPEQHTSQPLLRVHTATDDDGSPEASKQSGVPGLNFISPGRKRIRGDAGPGSMPKTPFPMLHNSDLESEGEGAGSWAVPSTAQPYPWSAQTFKSLPPFGSESAPRLEDQSCVLSHAMHGTMLALQSIVSLGVFSGLVCLTVWKNYEANEAFWQWLWAYIQPIVALLTLLPLGALLYHETHRLLSDATVLCLQSGSLLLVTPLAVTMAVKGLEQRSRCIGGWLVGCGVFLFGFAFLAFSRAVVVWRAQANGRGCPSAFERGYGTISPRSNVER